MLIVVAVACVLLSAIGVAFFGSNLINLVSGKGLYPTERFTLVFVDLGPNQGLNGSASHGINAVWPIFHVRMGDRVVIDVINSNSSQEPHNLAVQHYFIRGTPALKPGQSYTFSFIANKVGNFTVYEQVYSTLIPFDENGLMIVSK